MKAGFQKVEIKTPEEIRIMRRAGALVSEVLERVGEKIRPGVATKELDRVARDMISARGALPAFLGYQGFPGTLCISINEEVVHGIPGERRLEEGDIVSIDVGLVKDGFYGDTAKTFPVGKVDEGSLKLIAAAEGALAAAIPLLAPGRRMGDLSAAVQEYVEARGFSVVRDYAGHGVGRRLHEEPRIPNYGKPERGLKWQPGMVVAIEPMVNAGTYKTRLLDDQWTVVTADGKRSSHAEHTVAITEDGPLILTRKEIA